MISFPLVSAMILSLAAVLALQPAPAAVLALAGLAALSCYLALSVAILD